MDEWRMEWHGALNSQPDTNAHAVLFCGSAVSVQARLSHNMCIVLAHACAQGVVVTHE